MKSRQEQLELLCSKLEKMKFGMLCTVDQAKGNIRSRPMTNKQVESDATLWFMTSDSTAAAVEIGNEQHVNVSYSDQSDHAYISVSGRASIVRSKEKIAQLWQPIDKAWFPAGMEDPHIVLIRVDVTDAEYWDTPSNKVVELYALTKALVTGTPAFNLGEHAKLSNL